MRILLKIIRTQSSFQRYTSTLVKKLISNPQLLTADEIKSLLWTAADLRQKLLDKNEKVILNDIKDSKIVLLLTMPSIYHQLSAAYAAKILDANLNIVIDPTWDTLGYINDTMKFVQTHADLILAQCRLQCILDEVKQLNVPIFVYKSPKFKVIQTLADLLTMQLNFGYLKGLDIAFLGQPNRLLNTYLLLGTKLGVNITYYCCCNSGMQSPAGLKIAESLCKDTKSVLKECDRAEKAIEHAKVIILSKKGNHSVTHEMIKAASPDVKLHFQRPRDCHQVNNALISDCQYLTWEAADNMKWVFAAVMIGLLSDYKHTISMPIF
ncbi:hypothetical protein QE152_g6364 [Popillia japonica]|uniref:ornithine carbamoyltransferase n=1 Tax=Popillia japonica TaxID=7064 RepID=A0AAW1MIY8_POPJA